MNVDRKFNDMDADVRRALGVLLAVAMVGLAEPGRSYLVDVDDGHSLRLLPSDLAAVLDIALASDDVRYLAEQPSTTTFVLALTELFGHFWASDFSHAARYMGIATCEMFDGHLAVVNRDDSAMLLIPNNDPPVVGVPDVAVLRANYN